MANMRALSAALIDTNILIYQLNNSLPIGVQQALGLKLEAGQAFVSVITHIELLAWKNHTDASLRKTTALLQFIPQLSLSSPVIEETIRIRKVYGLKLPDAVIAATALIHDCSLWTSNETDFKRVTELSVYAI
jgi:predicted nucleic acid-binding protein